MNMLKSTFSMLLCAASAATAGAASLPSGLYTVGSFNGWDISAPKAFTKTAEGKFETSIDFSAGRTFKISTFDTSGMTGADAWTAFDEGSYNPVKTLSLNATEYISPGTQNIDAPGDAEYTVIVDFNLETMVITDGGTIAPPPGSGEEKVYPLYAVGAFNGWDVSAPLPFEMVDGVLTAVIDFSNGTAFKVSTSNTSGMEVQSGWVLFDQGAYCFAPGSVTALNKEISILPGIDNMEAPGSGTYTVLVNLTSGTIAFSDGGSVDPSTPYSGTIPVLFINTQDKAPIKSKEEYVKGSYYLDPMGVEGIDAIGSAEEPLPLQIKGRGNYTWTGFAKKPYRLKLDDKAAMLGMNKSKHWALMAHADDSRGFLRNPVGFWISENLGMEWTPGQEPVEVMLNGEYIGLYFLTETIRVAKDRVNVVEQPDLATDPTEVTGGWLVEIDNYNTDPHVTLIDGNGYTVWFTYKSPEILSSEQEQYLYSQMSKINDRVFGATDSQGLWDFVDMDQLAAFYLTQEITDNYESFHGSCYLHKDQGTDAKWKFGPVWDFGSSLFVEKNQFINFERPYYQVWIPQFTQFPAFMARVRDMWLDFSQNKFSELYHYIDDYADYIATACVYDAKRWPEYGNPDELQRAASVKEWLHRSCEWLTSQWGGTTGLDALPAGELNADPEYYTLQGVRVARPDKGIYIEVRGSQKRKVLF